MDASNVTRVAGLVATIREAGQAIYAIDNGAMIVAMTLRREEVLPTMAPAEPAPPSPPPQADEINLPPSDEQRPPEVFDDPGVAAIEVTIGTEGLSYPPQMMQTIRAQQVQLWKQAHDELVRLGVTNVAGPPS